MSESKRPLYKIAAEIHREWKNISIHARPYLDAMYELDSVEDRYGLEEGTMIVLYFLNNAIHWRGEVARRVKKELRSMV